MKLSFVSIITLVFALLLFVSAPLSLKDALTNNAITSRLDAFSQHPVQDLRLSDEQLADTALRSTSSAHHLNSIVLFNQWLSYLGQEDISEIDLTSILKTSTHIRPTWSNTYVELAKLSNSEYRLNTYSHLASLFGPYVPSSQLLMIDVTFSQWDDTGLNTRVEASQHLVSIASSWRHRPALNSMIAYSEGNQRICNLLAFNQIKVSACG